MRQVGDRYISLALRHTTWMPMHVPPTVHYAFSLNKKAVTAASCTLCNIQTSSSPDFLYNRCENITIVYILHGTVPVTAAPKWRTDKKNNQNRGILSWIYGKMLTSATGPPKFRQLILYIAVWQKVLIWLLNLIIVLGCALCGLILLVDDDCFH